MQLGMKEKNIFLVSSPIYVISKNNRYNKRRSLSASASTLISSVSRKIGPHSSRSQIAMKSPCVILRVRVVRPRPSSVCMYSVEMRGSRSRLGSRVWRTRWSGRVKVQVREMLNEEESRDDPHEKRRMSKWCRSPRASLQTGRKLRVFRWITPCAGTPPSSWLRLFGSLPSLAERKIGDAQRKGTERGNIVRRRLVVAFPRWQRCGYFRNAGSQEWAQEWIYTPRCFPIPR